MDSYTWSEEWGSDLLSPWGYFQRFQFANVMKHRDLHDLVQIKWLPPNINASDRANLVTFPALDEGEVRKIFHVSLREQTMFFLERFFNNATNASMYYPKPKLNTCPICIAHGFHSQLHQIKGVDSCAFHDVPLQNCCPACGKTHSYKLTDAGFRSPFICMCGYHYMDGLRSGIWHVELWRRHHAWIIKNRNILAMESMAHLYRINRRDIIQNQPHHLDVQTVSMVWETYKSFLRRLRRLNASAKSGVASLIDEHLSTFSAHTYAYMKIKMFAEHLDSFTMVDAGKRNLLDDLHKGLLSNTSDFSRLYHATMAHFQTGEQIALVQRILRNALILILFRRYEHYLQEGTELVLKCDDEKIRAVKRLEYKRTYKRRRRDNMETLIQYSHPNFEPPSNVSLHRIDILY